MRYFFTFANIFLHRQFFSNLFTWFDWFLDLRWAGGGRGVRPAVHLDGWDIVGPSEGPVLLGPVASEITEWISVIGPGAAGVTVMCFSPPVLTLPDLRLSAPPGHLMAPSRRLEDCWHVTVEEADVRTNMLLSGENGFRLRSTNFTMRWSYECQIKIRRGWWGGSLDTSRKRQRWLAQLTGRCVGVDKADMVTVVRAGSVRPFHPPRWQEVQIVKGAAGARVQTIRLGTRARARLRLTAAQRRRATN